MAHPDGDCEDCGRTHFPWSAHDRARRRIAYEKGDALVLYDELRQALDRAPVSNATKCDVLLDLELLHHDDSGLVEYPEVS